MSKKRVLRCLGVIIITLLSIEIIFSTDIFSVFAEPITSSEQEIEENTTELSKEYSTDSTVEQESIISVSSEESNTETEESTSSDEPVKEQSIERTQSRAIKSATWGNVNWAFDDGTGVLSFTSGGTLGEYKTSPWNRTDSMKISSSAIKKIVFTQKTLAPNNSGYLFGGLGWSGSGPANPENKLLYLESFEHLDFLDTSNATNMAYMFAYAGYYSNRPLTSLDVSSFNTSKVTNMQMMLGGMKNLKMINVSSFNTGQVTNFQNMFWAMNKVSSLDLSSFDFSKAINIVGIFSELTSVYELTLPISFRDTGYTSELPNITASSAYSGNWANKVTGENVGSSSNYMKTYNGTKPGTYIWQSTKVWGDVPWDFDGVTGTLTFTGGGTLGDYTTSPWNRTDKFKIASSSIKKIIFTQTVIAPVDSRNLFGAPGWSCGNSVPTNENSNLWYLEAIEGLTHLNTENTINMAYMFAYAGFYAKTPLTTLDVSSFDTSKVTNMQMMFTAIYHLSSIDVSKFSTSKVTNFTEMFWGHKDLTTLNLSSFDFSKATTKNNMLSNTTSLRELTLPETFKDPMNTVSLPAITPNATYNGNWRKKDGNTVGTTTQFMAGYDGSNPGTYIWETTVDTLNPKDTTQTELVLSTVPSAFSFTTSIQRENYTLSQILPTGQDIVVKNDRLDREWSVRAKLLNNQLTTTEATPKVFSVSSFKVNQTELAGTGAPGVILAQAPNAKTLESNIGSIQTPVTSASIQFVDVNHQLNAGTTLKGTIQYQLYNTAAAN
ncbi:BspA family leucine-rich repeat surface protein [Enterococcus sp. AZ126]|uniref:BspA family leucine-rich repeat surface protein n=1 Tax=Enterococcus sp. AZ126 TaxID=2774635 RepID=UPI003F22EE04